MMQPPVTAPAATVAEEPILRTEAEVLSAPLAGLERRLRERTARIGIVGLGYVGLPEAVMFAQAGFPVTGFDLATQRVDAVNAARSYVEDVSDAVLTRLVEAGRLRALPMPGADGPAASDEMAAQDCLCICVPTPLRKTRDPDISYIVGAVRGIEPSLRPGQLIVLESTTYPGTTEEVVQPLLEARGLRAGHDFALAFSPERVNPGDREHPPARIPKVVGGLTPVCTRLAARLYEQAVARVLPVSSARTAEMVKLLENTFRSVNIGLVNEVALMCHTFGLDVWEVIDAAASKPFGFMPFYPGPGLGGHCIPVDPFYLSWKARSHGFEARFIELAGQVNGSMPHHVVARVAHALNRCRKSINGSRILVLGVAYKANVGDVRESPALEILQLLHERGASLAYADAHVPALIAGPLRLQAVPLTPETVAAQDCVLVLTDHAGVDYGMIAAQAPLVVDTRNACRDVPPPRDHILKL
jgi:UDP-N-acetyl-D-glucosamine dehydrogenase